MITFHYLREIPKLFVFWFLSRNKTIMARIRPLMLLFFIVTLLNSGCLLQGKKQDRWKPIDQDTAPVVHEIQWKSETLSIISKWYTGDSQNWKSLADANPNINPHSLFLGNRIFIPSHLVKNQGSHDRRICNHLL